MIGLLRGINVGGHNRLPMADLRSIAQDCGLHDVQTYIQSGNVVFTTDETRPNDVGPEEVARRLTSAIHSSMGLTIPVTIRTRDDIVALLTGNPFLAGDDDPAHHHVLFRLASTHIAEDDLVEFDSFAPERLAAGHPAERDVYLYLPDGMGRSELATVVARRRALEGTVRNWRTVGKLLEIADAIEP